MKKDIKYIDTVVELLAYIAKRIFDTLKSPKKILLLALLLFTGIGAVVAAKYLMELLK